MERQVAVTHSEVVGRRGWPLQSSGDQAKPSVHVNVETEWGKPVKGKEGTVGWMRDHGAVSKKVSDIIIDISLS